MLGLEMLLLLAPSSTSSSFCSTPAENISSSLCCPFHFLICMVSFLHHHHPPATFRFSSPGTCFPAHAPGICSVLLALPQAAIQESKTQGKQWDLLLSPHGEEEPQDSLLPMSAMVSVIYLFKKLPPTHTHTPLFFPFPFTPSTLPALHPLFRWPWALGGHKGLFNSGGGEGRRGQMNH